MKTKIVRTELLDIAYINKPIIKLADLGTCIAIDKKSHSIQTRYYRAPEIILMLPYDEKCDVWSLGCVLYELLTREILFYPEQTKLLSLDRCHLFEINMLLGNIPNR